MISDPCMLVSAAEKAGIKVPTDPDKWDEEKESCPHFWIFCMTQLCRAMTWGEHWDNAKVIASISDEEIMKVTLDDLINRGLSFYPIP